MRRNGRAVLVEGYMDVIGVYAAGIKEVVASCGTALTNLQVRTIHRHADAVVLNFDPDSAGANAAERAIQLLLDEGLQVRVVALEGGLDPDDYVKQNGAEAYRAKVDGASTYFHWLADRARGKFDMRTSEGRMAAFKFLLPAVQKAPDKLERAAIAGDLAGYLGVDPGLVLEQFKKAATERKPQGPAPVARVDVPPLEKILLHAMLASDRARAEMLPELTPAITGSFVTCELFEGLRQAAGGGSGFSFSSLEARLTGPAQALLHSSISADDNSDEEVLWEQAQACLLRVKADLRKRDADELRRRVKAAEREGQVREALSLMAELSRLERDTGDAGAG
jgi:DNA primase